MLAPEEQSRLNELESKYGNRLTPGEQDRLVYLERKYTYHNANTTPNPYQGLDSGTATKRADTAHNLAKEYTIQTKRVEQDMLEADDTNIHQILTQKAPEINDPLPNNSYLGLSVPRKRRRTLDETIQYNALSLKNPRQKAQAREYIRQRELKKQQQDKKVANYSDVLDLSAYMAYFTGGEESSLAMMKANLFRNKPDLIDEQDDTISYLAENPNSSYVVSLFDTKLDVQRMDDIDKLSQMTTEERASHFKNKGDFGFSETFDKKDTREYMLFSDALKAIKNNELRGAIERVQDPESNYPKSKYTKHGYSPNYSKDLYIVRNHYFNLEEMQNRSANGWAKLADMGLDMAKYMGEIYLLSGIAERQQKQM